jgi:hypothetical protein
MSNSEISQWIDNDEGLYNWWKSSRQSKTNFIKENKSELTQCIKKVIDAPPPTRDWTYYR